MKGNKMAQDNGHNKKSPKKDTSTKADSNTTKFMNKVISLAITVLVVGVSYFAVKGLFGYFFRSDPTPTVTKESYIRLNIKSCEQEAIKGGVTEAQAKSYCNCVIDEIYDGKTLEQMRQVDSEFVKDGGLNSDKYDDVIIKCAEGL